jgi:lactoylglutathione lyase
MTTSRLTLLMIRAADVERTVAFYRELGLTFERERHGSGPVHYAADCDGTVFEIYPIRPGDRVTSSMRLGFSVRDVDAATDALIAVGGFLQSRRNPGIGDRTVVIDPEGNRVELVPMAA